MKKERKKNQCASWKDRFPDKIINNHSKDQ
jgi:hypothetical protein